MAGYSPDKPRARERQAKLDGFTTNDSTHFARPYVVSPALLLASASIYTFASTGTCFAE